jgi:hypothetical protein
VAELKVEPAAETDTLPAPEAAKEDATPIAIEQTELSLPSPAPAA